MPDAPEGAKTKAAAKPKSIAATKPPADRTALNAAELALRRLDDVRKEDEAVFRQRQDELDAAKMTAQSAYVEGRKAAMAVIVKAREAFRKAGGKD